MLACSVDARGLSSGLGRVSVLGSSSDSATAVLSSWGDHFTRWVLQFCRLQKQGQQHAHPGMLWDLNEIFR